MAARFDGQIFTFTQPDGTPIQLRGWGDQYYAVFETLDGYTVAKNPATGYWEVARLAPDGNALQPAAAPVPDSMDRVRASRRACVSAVKARMAAARESALRASGRRCEQRRRGTTRAAARHSRNGCRRRSAAGSPAASDGRRLRRPVPAGRLQRFSRHDRAR